MHYILYIYSVYVNITRWIIILQIHLCTLYKPAYTYAYNHVLHRHCNQYTGISVYSRLTGKSSLFSPKWSYSDCFNEVCHWSDTLLLVTWSKLRVDSSFLPRPTGGTLQHAQGYAAWWNVVHDFSLHLDVSEDALPPGMSTKSNKRASDSRSSGSVDIKNLCLHLIVNVIF